MKKSDMQKHTLWLREGDWAYIEALYKHNGVSTSLAIRSIVGNFVDEHRRNNKEGSNKLGAALQL